MMLFVLPVVLLAGYFSGGSVPAVVKYAPELCGIGASALIVIHAVRYGFEKIRFVYWVLIILLALHLLFGLIANGVQVGSVIIGGRTYLRTVPFFLLALTYFPSESLLRKQFLVVLGTAMLQLPVAVYQKISNYQRALTEGYTTMTGDWVVGTIGNSGLLSLFLIAFSTFVVALYARRIISMPVTVGILLIVLAPTMINETKATFFLAPLAIAIPIIAAAEKNRIRNSIRALFLAVGFLAVFLPVYDHFIMPRYGYGLLDFLTMEGRVEGYLAKGAQVGDDGPVGRLDGITIALETLTSDPSSAAFGLGMGSVTESAFGEKYQGKYYDLYGAFAGTTYARLFWEIGFLGAAFVLLLLYLVFSDARRLYRRPDTYGVLGLAYLAVVPLMVVGMLYKNLLLSPAIGICFWYYCGVIAGAANLPLQTASATETEVPRKARCNRPASCRHGTSDGDDVKRTSTRHRSPELLNDPLES